MDFIFFEKSLRFHLIQKFCSKAFGVDWVERIRIIYVGDDFTDEDAIKALKGSRIREIKKWNLRSVEIPQD